MGLPSVARSAAPTGGVAALPWNQWQDSPGIGGSFAVEYASLKDSPGLGGVYEKQRRGGEENPVHGRNTTVNVDKIKSFRPSYVWTKTFVFFLTIGP